MKSKNKKKQKKAVLNCKKKNEKYIENKRDRMSVLLNTVSALEHGGFMQVSL